MKNLRNILFFILILVTTLTSFAQNDNKSKTNETSFGVQFGYNQHWQVQDDSNSTPKMVLCLVCLSKNLTENL